MEVPKGKKTTTTTKLGVNNGPKCPQMRETQEAQHMLSKIKLKQTHI